MPFEFLNEFETKSFYIVIQIANKMKNRKNSIGTIILEIIAIGSIVAVVTLMTISVIKDEHDRHYSFDGDKNSIEYKFK